MNDRLHKSIYGQTLDEMKEDKGVWEYEQEPSREAFKQVMWERDIAIEQLHELGYELGQKIEPSGDLISRQVVLKIIDGWYDNNRDTENIEDLIILITYMSSVNPQKSETVTEFADRCRECGAKYGKLLKQGRWIGHREHCENLGVMPSGLGAYEWCSNCNCGIDVKEWHRNNYNYCPNCGAMMVKQESEGAHE